MGEGAVLPERASPDRTEVVLESERTLVTRLFVSRRTVIRKQPLGPDAQRRLRYELAILEQLRGIAGVAQVLDEPRYPGSITLADAGEASAALVVKPLAVEQLIGVAVGLAAAVAGMHGRGSDAPQHLSVQPCDCFRRHAVSGGFRVCDIAGRDTPGVHAPHQNCWDAAVFGTGADRTYRSFDGSARRLVRVGRDTV